MANNDRRTFNVARNKPAPVTQEQPALDDALIDDDVAPELVAQSAPQEEPVATAPLVEIAPAPAPVVAPVIAPAPAPVASPAPAEPIDNPIFGLIENAEFRKASIDLYRRDGVAGSLLCHLLDYSQAMRPCRAIDENTGMRNQAVLYRTMVGLLTYSGDNAARLHNIALHIFASFTQGAFGWSYVNRFMENISLSNTERKAFTAMTLMFTDLALATPAERRGVAQRFFGSVNLKSIVAVVKEDSVNNFRSALRLN